AGSAVRRFVDDQHGADHRAGRRGRSRDRCLALAAAPFGSDRCHRIRHGERRKESHARGIHHPSSDYGNSEGREAMAEEPTRMSVPDTGTRSPDEIRWDIERTRTDLHETVDAIERRLRPGELLDEFWGRMRGSGSSAGEVVKDRPVPLALMGLGLGWLAIEKATASDSKVSHRREDGPSVTWRPERDRYLDDDS